MLIIRILPDLPCFVDFTGLRQTKLHTIIMEEESLLCISRSLAGVDDDEEVEEDKWCWTGSAEIHLIV